MTSVHFQDVALSIAGVATGILALIMISTLREASRAPHRLSEREETFAELVALAEHVSRASDDPINGDDPTAEDGASHDVAQSARRLQAHLGAMPSSIESIEMVNHLLTLDSSRGPVASLVRESPAVRSWLTARPDDSSAHQISALRLIAEIGDASFLPSVLIAASDSNIELRRAGLRAMSTIAPARALNVYFRSIPADGAWALERLTQVVRQDGALSEFVGVHGEDHLIDMIGVLAEVLVGSDERASLAAIDTLGAIDHHASAAALLRTARSGQPMMSAAALDALSSFAEGREALRSAGQTTTSPTPRSTDQLFNDLRSILDAEVAQRQADNPEFDNPEVEPITAEHAAR